ncbi:YiiX/YebB-like N1pC/P60 family cysteine hydrolase [Candidatus Poriferisocius sp.]|uniref:YiiX/YebB-like N1pC/P60 family cysteine hydrolase n=1 Tax=Candidatus Poriferisocius sp. TaxID=3101276 RepID=UPI003B01BCE1
MKPRTYEDLRPQLRTGDIVLFAGRSAVSKLIRCVTHSRWSHVGMIIRYEPDAVFVWESTVRKGVALSAFSRRIATYPGHVAVRRRRNILTDTEESAIHEFRRRVSGTGFERSPFQMLGSALQGIHNRADESRFFCSELVAATFKAADLLPSDRPSNEYTPDDFALLLTGCLGESHHPLVEIFDAR